MYFWLWQRLPGPWPAKLLSSAVLMAGVVAVLLIVVFPRIEPLLPFQQVTVDSPPAPLHAPAPIAHISAPARAK